MKYLFIAMIFVSTHAQARCNNAKPIYICNYITKPKIRDLSEYEAGWNEIKFDNIKKTIFKTTSKKKLQSNTVSFLFLKKMTLPLMNYKIEIICNDVMDQKAPNFYALITPVEDAYCKQHPESSLIYP